MDDNQWVQQGSVLVEFDPTDYEVAVAQARANLASAEATAQALNITVPITSVDTSSQLQSTASNVENASAGVVAAERQLAAAQAQVESAEASDVRAQDDVKRYKLLVDKQEVASQVYDQALATAKSSSAAVAAARANEAAAQQFVQQAGSRVVEANANHQSAETGPQQVSSTRARVRAAIADVEQKRALLNQAELNLQYTKIFAPVSGEVNKTVVVGLKRSGRAAVAYRCSSRRSLGHSKFQRDATQPHASRAESGNSRGFDRTNLKGPRRQHCRGNRPSL